MIGYKKMPYHLTLLGGNMLMITCCGFGNM